MIMSSGRPSLRRAPSRHRLLIVVSLLVLLGLWFGFLEHRELFHPDEGRYAEIPREMLSSGDWVTPRLNGLKYFEKPILQYWATAAAYRIFGIDEWTARLWTAVCGFMTLVFTFVTARRYAGPAAGALAAAALASSALFLAFSQILTLDMGVSCFLALSLCAWCGLLDDRLPAQRRRAWALVFWGAMGLAMLSKGLIGVVLPVAVIGSHVLMNRNWRVLREMHAGPGILLFLAVTLPWFALVSWRNPGFLQFFFIHEHFARYANAGHHRPGPWWFFIAMLLVGSMPWTPVYLQALWAAIRSSRPPWRPAIGVGIPQRPAPSASEGADDGASYESLEPLASGRALAARVDARRLLLVWVILITAFFSASHSKLPAYIVPVFPALAMLFGMHAAGRPIAALLPWRSLALLGTGLMILPLIGLHVPGFNKTFANASNGVTWLALSGVLMLGVAVAGRALRGRAALAASLFALGTVAGLQLLLAGAQTVAADHSAEAIVARAEKAAQGFNPHAPFFSVGTYDQTLPMNLRRLLTLVDYSDEFAFGIAQQPDLALPGLIDFRGRWLQAAQAYALMTPAVYEFELAQGLPMVELGRSPRYVIVARRAALPGEVWPFLPPL